MLVVGAALPSWAEQVFSYGEADALFDTAQERDGHLSFGALGRLSERYFDAKDRVHQQNGSYWFFEDRLINQWGDGSRINDNELNLIARQEFARAHAGGWSLNLWGQFANSLGGKTGGEFQSDLGILSPLNGGNSGPDKSNEILQMAALEYVAPEGAWRAQAGKLSLRMLVNLNRYANGDSEMFFSPMLGNNPVVPYTALLGLGAYGQYQTEAWSLAGLVRAPDTELGLTLDGWEAGNRGYVVEAALTPDLPGLGEGIYRLTWSLDEANDALPRMETWSLSTDQDFGPRLGGFFRYAWAETTFRDFDQRLAAGFQVKKPLGLTHDRLGLGYWWGHPSDATLDPEQGLEIFYKAQISRFLEITPDIQLVKDPAFSTRDSDVVLGLRLRLFF
ncbi:MAG: carbohydrate porin [Mangrovicoccus sp.]